MPRKTKKYVVKVKKEESIPEISQFPQDGDYDPEDLDLAEDLSPEDFEDRLSTEADIDDMDSMDILLGIFSESLTYNEQGLTEILAQIRDSIDTNTKCMLRIAEEIAKFNKNKN